MLNKLIEQRIFIRLKEPKLFKVDKDGKEVFIKDVEKDDDEDDDSDEDEWKDEIKE